MEKLRGSNFPFQNLEVFKYSTIEIMKYLRYGKGLKFLWRITRDGREFVKQHHATIKREFENEGLYIYSFVIKNDERLSSLKNYFFIEKLYL